MDCSTGKYYGSDRIRTPVPTVTKPLDLTNWAISPPWYICMYIHWMYSVCIYNTHFCFVLTASLFLDCVINRCHVCFLWTDIISRYQYTNDSSTRFSKYSRKVMTLMLALNVTAILVVGDGGWGLLSAQHVRYWLAVMHIATTSIVLLKLQDTVSLVLYPVSIDVLMSDYPGASLIHKL